MATATDRLRFRGTSSIFGAMLQWIEGVSIPASYVIVRVGRTEDGLLFVTAVTPHASARCRPLGRRQGIVRTNPGFSRTRTVRRTAS